MSKKEAIVMSESESISAPPPTTKSIKLWATISKRGQLRSVLPAGTAKGEITLHPDEILVRATLSFEVPLKKNK